MTNMRSVNMQYDYDPMYAENLVYAHLDLYQLISLRADC